jgi:putative ABC transport system substrate-binding protein
MSDVRRRAFIMLIGGAAAAWPLAARAQQQPLPVVAFINVGSPETRSDRVAAFRKGLSETGYTASRGRDCHPGSGPAVLAAKAATATIPIVFGVAENPVGLGLVKSLAQPGGNATGINFFGTEIDAKRLGLMHELLPKASRFAVLVNPANVRYTEATSKALREAAQTLGIELVFFNASTPAEIDAAFAALTRERAQALFIAGEAIFSVRRMQLATLTARDRIPASYVGREGVEAGLLMSYGTSLVDMARQVGVYTGSILRGAKPSELPVLQATKFEFVINLQTARALGVEISPMLLARADEVIE